MVIHQLKRFLRWLKIQIKYDGNEPQISQIDYLRAGGAIIGENVFLYNVLCSQKDASCLEIGNNVTLSGVQILTHDASMVHLLDHNCLKIGRVVIGSNVFVGVQSVILPNVHIGDNVIIGAGSIVTKDIPNNSVAVGNPAKVICTLEEYLEKHKNRMQEESLVYWDNDTLRDKMTPLELARFNHDIDGKIVYFKNNW